MKLCRICNIEKDDKQFYKCDLLKKSIRCIPCAKIYKKQYYLNNKNFVKNNVAVYKSNNKEKIKKLSRSYYEKNRKLIDPKYKLRMLLSNRIYCFLKNRNGSKNNKSILDCLPYTVLELKIHLESMFEVWMNWSNWGRYNLKTWNNNDQSTWTWQIDHIMSHSSFNYTSMDEQAFKDCWALSNLRPFSAKQNLLDGNRKI